MPTAGSRSSRRADLAGRLESALPAVLAAGGRVAIALSGGRDSIALLEALVRLRDAGASGLALRAVHVDHGLRPAAAQWAAFCVDECRRRGVPIDVFHLSVARAGGESLEENARRERYRALASADADVVALAHHRDDQAETVLLQLLRGAGPRGIAAMAPWTAGHPAWWRPLLEVSRAEIEAYCSAHGLAWIDDDSNADPSIRRNFLRTRILPELDAVFPGARAGLARTARHQAGAARLLRDLAEIDAGGDLRGPVALARLRQLNPERCANLLREWIRTQGLRAPAESRLAEWMRQLRGRGSGQLALRHEGQVLRVHRDRLLVAREVVADFDLAWRSEPELALPHGILSFRRVIGDGVRADALRGRDVRVRPRRGGERLRLAHGGPTRMLKSLLRERGVPAWERDLLPLVFAGGELVCVPGVAVAAGFAAGPAEPGVRIEWQAR